MTVGFELVCCAGAGTADANTTKNKGRTRTNLLFIRTSCLEELPNSPRLLRTMSPSYCPLGNCRRFNTDRHPLHLLQLAGSPRRPRPSRNQGESTIATSPLCSYNA